VTGKNYILSGAAALAIAAAAFAAPSAFAAPVPQATSYADLFEPVPDAAARLNAADAFARTQPRLMDAQYWRDDGRYYHHHHHHHHHHHSARWFYDHGYVWNGWGWVPRPIYHHHHHHHHHHYRYYRW